jgi:hypothetical protein
MENLFSPSVRDGLNVSIKTTVVKRFEAAMKGSTIRSLGLYGEDVRLHALDEP